MALVRPLIIDPVTDRIRPMDTDGTVDDRLVLGPFTLQGDMDMNGNKVTDVGAGSGDNDSVQKTYVDAKTGGVNAGRVAAECAAVADTNQTLSGYRIATPVNEFEGQTTYEYGNLLVFSGPTWSTNEWAGYEVENVTSGEWGTVVSNTAYVLTPESYDFPSGVNVGDTIIIWGATYANRYIDGVTLTNGMRVLLIGQSSASTNGIWVTSTGSWTRPADFYPGDNSAGIVVPSGPGGTMYPGKLFVCTPSSYPAAINTIDPNPITNNRPLIIQWGASEQLSGNMWQGEITYSSAGGFFYFAVNFSGIIYYVAWATTP